MAIERYKKISVIVSSIIAGIIYIAIIIQN